MQTTVRTALVLCLGILLAGCASLDVTSPQYERSKTYDFTDKKQDKLYVAINDWLSQSANSQETEVEFTDKEAGKISAKIITQGVLCGPLEDFYLTADWTFDVKDGAYRVRVDPLHVDTNARRKTTSLNEKCGRKVLREVTRTMRGLETHIVNYESF